MTVPARGTQKIQGRGSGKQGLGHWDPVVAMEEEDRPNGRRQGPPRSPARSTRVSCPSELTLARCRQHSLLE